MTWDKWQAASGWAPTAQEMHGGTEMEGGRTLQRLQHRMSIYGPKWTKKSYDVC